MNAKVSKVASQLGIDAGIVAGIAVNICNESLYMSVRAGEETRTSPSLRCDRPKLYAYWMFCSIEMSQCVSIATGSSVLGTPTAKCTAGETKPQIRCQFARSTACKPCKM